MNHPPRGGNKKRKQSADDSEKSLYHSFVHAANAVSQLYAAATQQQRRSQEQGARQALERVAQFVVKEYGNAPAVPTAVLMEVLRQELQASQGSAAAVQLPFPMPLPLLPTDSDEHAHSDDETLMSEQPTPGTFRRSTSGHQISPPKTHRGSSGLPGVLPGLAQQQQQTAAAAHAQQQQQMQAQMAAMQQAVAMQQQQQQQQQHQGGFGFPGQLPFQQ